MIWYRTLTSRTYEIKRTRLEDTYQRQWILTRSQECIEFIKAKYLLPRHGHILEKFIDRMWNKLKSSQVHTLIVAKLLWWHITMVPAENSKSRSYIRSSDTSIHQTKKKKMQLFMYTMKSKAICSPTTFHHAIRQVMKRIFIKMVDILHGSVIWFDKTRYADIPNSQGRQDLSVRILHLP